MGFPQDTEEFRKAFQQRRKCLLDGLDPRKTTGVEIGALCRPMVQRTDGNIIYVDHVDTEALKRKYQRDPDVDAARLVNVDAVWGANTLHQAINGRFVDYVIASHVVEHVPDVVSWLQELASILSPTGEVRLAVPDKRFTFDCLRRETSLSDVLLSYMAKARIPQPHCLLDFAINAAKIDAKKAWKGITQHAAQRHYSWQEALGLAEDSLRNGNYHDVHCWVFTPRSFARLLGDLAQAGLTDLACERFIDTKRWHAEFFVHLRRSRDRTYVVETWRAMEKASNMARPGSLSWSLRNVSKRLRPNGALHPLSRTTGRPSELDPREPLGLPTNFSPNEYLRIHPDVKENGADPASHYKLFGWYEGRPYKATPSL
ncbi:class I SAM-dependent methyltransferase [Cupriavidus sp. DB3]|uniref:class I SAM-dependent methyltransferase n=1 Tax=Cupriavidus sp. DB3 TaxID=2873259 RepID=UPI001CF206DF|nr:class I SAM-dependent methyltransferase [Cupriavidus sp. DB3]MCA7086038.1 class I SAM-dependent methyltransferase [Cupriavidus sp. DB3]